MISTSSGTIRWLRAPSAAFCGLLVSIAALVGCQKQEEIQHYEVARLEQTVSPPTVSVDRMLAAIVPHGDKFWFFKVVGPDSVVIENQRAFGKFLNSLEFPAPADAPPKWTLPAGWTQKPGTEMRLATIVMNEDKTPLEMAISSLPKPADDDKPGMEKALLENVNRWRGQFRLRPIGKERLADELHKLKMGDSPGYLIAITGKMQAGGMPGAPFAGGPSGGGNPDATEGKPLPAGHPPIALPADHPPLDSTGAAANNPAATNPAATNPGSGDLAKNDSSGLKFKKPEGWSAGPATGFSALSFVASDGDRQAQITATALGGELNPESLLANVNRWRRQIGLEPLEQDKLRAAVKKMPVGGVGGEFVELVGPEKTILGVVVGHGDRLWFFKLQADPKLADRERDNFQSFVKSIQFADEGEK